MTYNSSSVEAFYPVLKRVNLETQTGAGHSGKEISEWVNPVNQPDCWMGHKCSILLCVLGGDVCENGTVCEKSRLFIRSDQM